jgi:hypothetical protein
MKPIENIELGKVVADAQVVILKEKEKEVQEKIVYIIRDLEKWNKNVEAAERGLREATEKRDKIQDSILKIQAGDWTAIKDKEEKVENKT